MNGDYLITANFSQITLTMAVNGSGSITPTVGSHTYPVGATVNITATPTSGWRFVNWTGDVADNTSSSTNVTMNTDKTVTANFNRIAGTLIMAVSGNGTDLPPLNGTKYNVVKGDFEDAKEGVQTGADHQQTQGDRGPAQPRRHSR